MARKKDRGESAELREIEAAMAPIYAEMDRLDAAGRLQVSEQLRANFIARGLDLSAQDHRVLEQFAQGDVGFEAVAVQFRERLAMLEIGGK
jgi:hypothetical protein